MQKRNLIALALFAAVGCNLDHAPVEPGSPAAPGHDRATPGEDGPGDDAPGAGDTPDDGAPDDGEETPGETAPPLRFAVIGDAGSGNDTQYAVADSVDAICGAKGCEFALYLGDNFYSDGVDDIDDDQFVEKFELPYANIAFPFYVVLGNHDYGGEGSGEEQEKPEPQVEYSRINPQWKLPTRYYSHAQAGGAVEFFGLDTNAMIWGWAAEQLVWAKEAIPASAARWKIAYGHHPYYSNGPHGDAGHYDGNEGWGSGFRDFMDEAVCAEVDVYFSGHDHSLQWLEPKCGKAELIISGAGSKVSEVGTGGGHDSHYESATPGFMWVEIVGDTFTGEYYDDQGALLYTRTFTRTN